MKKSHSISPSSVSEVHILLFLFSVTFLLIQPSKIVAAALSLPLLLGNFLIPVPFYIVHLFRQNEFFQIRSHLKILGAQAFLLLFSIVFSSIYANNYLFFFLFTPHYFLMAWYLFDRNPNDGFFPKALAIYIIALLLLCLASLATYDFKFSFEEEVSGILTTFFNRKINLQRGEILEAVNFSKQLFGTSAKTLEGVALTVYPLLYLGIIQASWPKFTRSKLHLTAIACSLMIIAFKSSRGELLFICTLAAYPLFRALAARFRWVVLLPLGLGFIQLFLNTRTLNGRGLLNDLFLKNITLLGNGIGFSADAIFPLSQNRYTSFHNIHMDIITNFGLLLYFLFIVWIGSYLVRREYTPAKHLIICFGFVLFSTNFEVFDLYFWIPVAYTLANNGSKGASANSSRQGLSDYTRPQIFV